MPERPLIILPAPAQPAARRKKRGGAGRFHRPSRERQVERLSPRFEQLQRAIEAQRARLQTEPAGIVPEQVVLLETIGSVDGFISAVQKVPEMEWLGEVEKEDIPPDDDFFALNKKKEPQKEKPLRGRLFLVLTNQRALSELLSLWDRWKAGQELPRGLKKWRSIFEQLRDVRSWGVRERLEETGVLEDWQERVEHGQENVPCEIELWFRQDPRQRKIARDRVVQLVTSLKGEIINESVIEDISYHALLAKLPITAVKELLEHARRDVDLVQCEQIQFFRATGQMAAVIPDGERLTDNAPIPESTAVREEAVVALLDGLPLQSHRRLAGRLIVDDPDNFESEYQARERRHGTAMASLILYGDLAADDPPLERPLYVRPILRPDPRDWRRPREETVPEDTLVVDLIHRAVRRLFGGEGGQPPTAPRVVVINLSIGIRDRLFDGALSPLARLLDWLAWRYKVLFVVSSGNHPDSIRLSLARNELASLTRDQLQEQIIRAVAADVRNRRLLSPAEAVNVVTVGALHDDESDGAPPPRWVDPYIERGLPSPINAQGMGYRRAIKPEILAPGGRVVVQESLETTPEAVLNIYDGTRCPGQLVAAPGMVEGELNTTWYIRGTSSAAALTSRAAAILYDVLMELRDEPGGEIIEMVPLAVWLKALLAHGANWGRAGEVLESLLRTPENTRQFKEYVTRLLGYGAVDVERVKECTAYRATAISGGILTADQAHIHRYPLPPSLSGEHGYRKLTITLAWFTPVNPRHQGWRRADLWFHPDPQRLPKSKDPFTPLRLKRREADARAAQRGTLQHEIFEGDRAAAFVDGDNLEIQVSCRADAGNLEDEIPYALVTTLEVAEEIGVPIYEEVRVRVHAARVRVAPSE